MCNSPICSPHFQNITNFYCPSLVELASPNKCLQARVNSTAYIGSVLPVYVWHAVRKSSRFFGSSAHFSIVWCFNELGSPKPRRLYEIGRYLFPRFRANKKNSYIDIFNDKFTSLGERIVQTTNTQFTCLFSSIKPTLMLVLLIKVARRGEKIQFDLNIHVVSRQHLLVCECVLTAHVHDSFAQNKAKQTNENMWPDQIHFIIYPQARYLSCLHR